MKIIIAPDSFKGCLRSPQVCEKIREGIKDALPDAETVVIPMADGGEGTVEATVKATGGKIEKIKAHDPLGREIESEFGIINSNTAILEMASASGLELLKENELNPLKTTTYGTGEIIREILRRGIKKIVIGIGGSATVDGGCGMARALGFNLLDRTGTPLPRFFSGRDLSELKSIDRNSVMPELEKAEITVACDVTNPLLGPKGAAAIFAPQKGATAKDVRILEKNLRNYSETLIKEKMLENTNAPGDGAAGGLGAGLRAFCNAEIKSGAEIIMEITGLKKHLKDADILITGEGCTDSQTSSGKLCGGVAKAAKEKNVPAILLSGALEGNIENLYNMFTAVFSIAAGPCSLREAVDMAEKNLYTYGRNIAAIAKALGK